MADFQLLSLGILPAGARRTITAAVTFVTAPGGEPNDFNSVKFALFRVFRASWAANRAGSAFIKSISQSFCFFDTSSAIMATFDSSSSAERKRGRVSEIRWKRDFLFFFFLPIAFSFCTLSVSTPTIAIRVSAASFFCCNSNSCIASFSFNLSTCTAVERSFSNPFSSLATRPRSSLAFVFNSLVYKLICSRNDFGVV